LRGNGRYPRGILLDAGPLIALAHSADPDHKVARAGFESLVGRRVQMTAPLPVIFEVYKWLLYHAGSRVALDALAHMRSALSVVYPMKRDIDQVAAFVEALSPDWAGTLEDALVAVLASRLRLPVWTLNYRDFGTFRWLRLWTPFDA